jgi:hypothetical protein
MMFKGESVGNSRPLGQLSPMRRPAYYSPSFSKNKQIDSIPRWKFGM